MKNLKKLFAALFSLTAVFLFFACSNDDTEEDENLEVTISASGSESNSSRTITLSVPSEYSNKGVYIIYTLDESTPELKFDKDTYSKSTTTSSIAEYIDYGTASLYEKSFQIGETTTIKALAFYVDATNKQCVKGSDWASKTVTISVTKTDAATASSEATGATSGEFTFTLATTGNSNQTHYFDTYRTNVFKLNEAHPQVYYQTQFSWKGKGKGNWYLYMRDLNGQIIPYSQDSNFLAKGTYSGECFDDAHGVVAKGDLTLFNGTDTTNGKKATVTESTDTDKSPYYFELKVNNTGAVSSSAESGSSGSGSSSSYDTFGTFTVDAK